MKKLDLKFYKNVKALDLPDYKYWRRLLPKVLKVGAELEFNLKKASGTCRGYSDSCMCSNTECDAACIFLKNEECALNIKSRFNCKTATIDCLTKDCTTCNLFKLKCDNLACINYTPKCIVCESLSTQCMNCPNKFDPSKTPETVRKNTEVELEATNNFGQVGRTGVLQVVADGSLENKGLEVPTVGRRLNFETFRSMFDNIIKTVKKNGGYVDDRCSIHVHVLNEYYTKVNNYNGASRNPDQDCAFNLSSFEKNMPDIILTNIIQLWRRYETAIYWLSCGLPYNNSITRWEKFRASLLSCSPVTMSIEDIKDDVARRVGKARYGALNLCNTKLDGSRLHLEFRTCDMILSPSYISAICCLLYALIIKAVDISCYGLLKVEDSNWINKEKIIRNSFINGAENDYGGERVSYTKNLDKYIPYLKSETHELLDLLAPILSGFESAEKVLRKIADKPVAFRLKEQLGNVKDPMNDYNIEQELSEENNKTINTVAEYILKTMALGKIQGCTDQKNWVEEVVNDVEDTTITESSITEYVSSLVKTGDVYWNEIIGSYLYR